MSGGGDVREPPGGWPKPSLTGDCVVFARADAAHAPRVLLIQREREPFRGRWAIPGGFCEPNETVEQAAARELTEETGLGGVELEQLRVFSKPGRDPRGWIVAVAHVAVVSLGKMAEVVSGDDAAAAAWARVGRLADGRVALALGDEPPVAAAGLLAFDHADVLEAAVRWLEARDGAPLAGGA